MPAETAADEVLTAEEACDFLRIKERTLRRWIAERGLPAAKVGRLLRFRRGALLEWLAAQENDHANGDAGHA